MTTPRDPVRHRIKRVGRMSQPAEGHYVDCACGRTGSLASTPEAARQDHDEHVRSNGAYPNGVS